MTYPPGDALVCGEYEYEQCPANKPQQVEGHYAGMLEDELAYSVSIDKPSGERAFTDPCGRPTFPSRLGVV